VQRTSPRAQGLRLREVPFHCSPGTPAVDVRRTSGTSPAATTTAAATGTGLRPLRSPLPATALALYCSPACRHRARDDRRLVAARAVRGRGASSGKRGRQRRRASSCRPRPRGRWRWCPGGLDRHRIARDRRKTSLISPVVSELRALPARFESRRIPPPRATADHAQTSRSRLDCASLGG
jgi:hypothetical protein